MVSKASKEVMKEINEKLLLREIYNNGGIDRASLAKMTGLSPATVSNVVSQLLENGLILETGVADSTGGRKPILLELNARKHRVLGLKIGLGYLDYVLADLAGSTLMSERKLIDPITPEQVIADTRGILSEWSNSVSGELLGIGVAVSGIVDSPKGVVKNSYLLNWKDVPFAGLLSQRCETKVHVMNDVDSFALAQFWKGSASRYKNCVFITLGVGIGGAIAVDGKLHTSSAGAGEFGHMTIERTGNLCTCGGRGCLEAHASFQVLAREVNGQTSSDELKGLYHSLKATETSEIDFLKRAVKLDLKTVKNVFQVYAVTVGIALKNLVNVFAPDYFLIGGEALEFSDFFLEKALTYARGNAFSGLADNTLFDIDKIGERAWTLGAVFRVIERELFAVKR